MWVLLGCTEPETPLHFRKPPIGLMKRQVNPIPILNTGERNGTRMDAYHRLDLGANFHKEKKNGIRTWSVGVYNAFNRRNPYFVYLGTQRQNFGLETGSNQNVARQVSLFPFLPSVTYNFKF